MTDLARGPATVTIAAASGGVPPAVLRHLVEVLGPDGCCEPVTADEVTTDGSLVIATGRNARCAVRLVVDTSSVIAALDLHITWTGEPADVGLRVPVELSGTIVSPRWLVPGSFYRENRPAGTAGTYPRAILGNGGDAFDSSWWSFRADRAAAAAVFGWTEDVCVGLATDPMTGLGMTGVGFSAETARVWVDLPYREGPVVYRGSDVPGAPVTATHRWQPGDEHHLRLQLTVGEADPHAYDLLLRDRYERDRGANELAPWMEPADAAPLLAHGLLAWHWHPEHDVLYETAAFDRAQSVLDRPSMHVAWVSGVPWAQTLLAHGRRAGDAAAVEAGIRVIDLVCSARTPGGTFWGEWRRDAGWGCGWNRDPDRLHARTLAEATLFTLRAVAAESELGHEHPSWVTAVADNLDVVVRAEDDDGNLGSYYHQTTGEVVDRSGAAGLLWIAALVEGARVLERPDLLDIARRAADYYARFVDDAFVHGAPEDVHLAPSSEDAYNALIAYVRLHEADHDARWLGLARRAADWAMTFRWTYNVAFGEHTILRHYDFRTRGADNASPPNQHLHAYGLVALEELLILWRATGDGHYLDRARDNLACFLQLIAREDGDFNAGRGMVTERYYHTDCFQPKGSMLTLSHAWCIGVTLLGCQVALDAPDAFPPGLRWARPDDPEPT